ncbi:hypothetical protein F5890DRAFT_1418868, partial [Lentinula detonsa]
EVFNVPTILTMTTQQGSLPPLRMRFHCPRPHIWLLDPMALCQKKSLRCIPPSAPLIKCQSDVNAWDNADFHAAVKATGKK